MATNLVFKIKEVLSVTMLYLHNGRIFDGETFLPPGEALLIEKNTIFRIGREEELRNLPEFAAAIPLNAQGGTILPAFTDSHVHLASAARHRFGLNCSGTTSREEVLEMIREEARKREPGQWIYGILLNEQNWKNPVLPERKDLDALDIPNPVLLVRICTHIHVANSRGLALGEALDEKGALSQEARSRGILQENEARPVTDALARALRKDPRMNQAFQQLFREFLEAGIGEVHVIGGRSIGLGDELGYYEILHRRGNLPLRIIGYYDDMPNIPVTSGFGNFWVRYGGCKLYLDGSLGGGTAALTEPYADRPGTGTLLYSDTQLTELLQEMGDRRIQPQIHAIGDAAIDQLIRCVRKAKEEGATWPYPVKASHLQVCRPDQVQQLGELEIAGDVQPHQLVSDVHMAPARLGEKRKDWCFPFRSMMDAGVLLVGSSDCPVEPINPLLGIRGALVRQNPESYPREGWNPAEKISLEEALAMYTRNPARLTGRDDKKGSLRQGCRADITVLDKDLSSLKPDELPGVQTRAVLVNGAVRYSA